MNVVLTPTRLSHFRTASAVNSGPLSDRMCRGVPLVMNVVPGTTLPVPSEVEHGIREDASVSCYFLAQIEIHDPGRYDEYLAGSDEVFERFQGQVLAVDDQVTVLEGEWPCSRTVLIRFPDRRELDAWYRSEEYQRLARHRRAAATASIVAVEGRD